MAWERPVHGKSGWQHCPYNDEHIFPTERLQWHFLKCTDKPKKAHLFEECMFNAQHVVGKLEIDNHYNICPDRPLRDVDDRVLKAMRQSLNPTPPQKESPPPQKESPPPQKESPPQQNIEHFTPAARFMKRLKQEQQAPKSDNESAPAVLGPDTDLPPLEAPTPSPHSDSEQQSLPAPHSSNGAPAKFDTASPVHSAFLPEFGSGHERSSNSASYPPKSSPPLAPSSSSAAFSSLPGPPLAIHDPRVAYGYELPPSREVMNGGRAVRPEARDYYPFSHDPRAYPTSRSHSLPYVPVHPPLRRPPFYPDEATSQQFAPSRLTDPAAAYSDYRESPYPPVHSREQQVKQQQQRTLFVDPRGHPRADTTRYYPHYPPEHYYYPPPEHYYYLPNRERPLDYAPHPLQRERPLEYTPSIARERPENVRDPRGEYGTALPPPPIDRPDYFPPQRGYPEHLAPPPSKEYGPPRNYQGYPEHGPHMPPRVRVEHHSSGYAHEHIYPYERSARQISLEYTSPPRERPENVRDPRSEYGTALPPPPIDRPDYFPPQRGYPEHLAPPSKEYGPPRNYQGYPKHGSHMPPNHSPPEYPRGSFQKSSEDTLPSNPVTHNGNAPTNLD